MSLPFSLHLYESVSLEFHVKDAGDANSAANAVQTQIGDFRIVAILQSHAERRQEWRPTQLENRNKFQRCFSST